MAAITSYPFNTPTVSSFLPSISHFLFQANRAGNFMTCLEADERPQNLIGIVKGEKLGEGGGGVVHKCRLLGQDTIYAVKESHNNPLASRQLIHESYIMKQLRYAPYLASEGSLYADKEARLKLIMPLYGTTLLSKLLEKNLSKDEKLRLAKELVKGAINLLDRDVIHLDVKPENIFCDQSILIGDFGAALHMPAITDLSDQEGCLKIISQFAAEHTVRRSEGHTEIYRGVNRHYIYIPHLDAFDRALQTLKLRLTVNPRLAVGDYIKARKTGRSLFLVILGMNLYTLFSGRILSQEAINDDQKKILFSLIDDVDDESIQLIEALVYNREFEAREELEALLKRYKSIDSSK